MQIHRHQNKVNHCRIRSKHERGQIKYYLIEGATFDSLFSLITYYRTYALRIQVNNYIFTANIFHGQFEIHIVNCIV